MCPDYVANADPLSWGIIGVMFVVLIAIVLITPTPGR